MPNTYFDFKQFRIDQSQSGMKVTTEGCILGAHACADNPKHILDIGAGTGLLSLMLAQKYSEASIDAVELEPNAANEATANFLKSKWSEHLSLHSTSIQDFTDSSNLRYDLIVCNPPFFTNTQRSINVKKARATHSDLMPMQELIESLLILLASKGVAFVLYPLLESKEFEKGLASTTLGVKEETLIYDRKSKSVFRRILKIEHSSKVTTSRQILIVKKDNGDYTDKFIQLLEPYYLHL